MRTANFKYTRALIHNNPVYEFSTPTPHRYKLFFTFVLLGYDAIDGGRSRRVRAAYNHGTHQ